MSSSFDQMEELYRRQFRVELGKLVFRKNEGGKPYPVTEDEMEECVAGYLRLSRFLIYGGVAVIMLLVGAVIWWGGDEWVDAGAMWLLLIPFVGVIGWGSYWIRDIPTRDIRRRVPIGAERDKDEVAREQTKRISWGTIAGATAATLVFSVFHVEHWPPLSADDWAYTSLAGFVVVMALFGAFRKWRLERR